MPPLLFSLPFCLVVLLLYFTYIYIMHSYQEKINAALQTELASSEAQFVRCHFESDTGPFERA